MVFFGFFGNGGDQFSWGTTNGDDESQTNSAKTDTDNSATPNNDWGHGKLDVAAGVAYLAANYTTCNMRLLSTLSNQVAMAIDKSLACLVPPISTTLISHNSPNVEAPPCQPSSILLGARTRQGQAVSRSYDP